MSVLLIGGLPAPVTFFVVGFFGIVLVKDWAPALAVIQETSWASVADFSWSLIPLFIILGVVLFECGIGHEIFRAVQRWLGHVPGGMAAATSAACAFLGTITGASAAATILMAKTAYPEMRKVNYEPGLSLAVCAASGTVAMLIPPSVMLVIYAIITEQSISETLLAGFIPGFLSMAIYMAMILIRARFQPNLGPPSPVATWHDRLIDLRYLLPPVIMMLTIIGGLYFGIFTATEAGGIAALISFIIVLALRRLTWARLKATLYDTIRFSILVTLIIVTIMGFYVRFLHVTWITVTIAEWALGLPSPWIILAAMYLFCFVFGMLVGGSPALLVLPLFTPVVEQLGFSPIWFIITIVKTMETGFITPPVAMSVFIAQGIIREVSLEKAYKAIWWFVLCDMLTLGLFIAFPQIVTFLPGTMRAVR